MPSVSATARIRRSSAKAFGRVIIVWPSGSLLAPTLAQSDFRVKNKKRTYNDGRMSVAWPGGAFRRGHAVAIEPVRLRLDHRGDGEPTASAVEGEDRVAGNQHHEREEADEPDAGEPGDAAQAACRLGQQRRVMPLHGDIVRDIGVLMLKHDRDTEHRQDDAQCLPWRWREVEQEQELNGADRVAG